MLTLTKIKELQQKYELNIHAKKRFGQNFLIDKTILKKIIKVADIKNKEVVEVGPGMGSLTIFLLEMAKELTAFEIDQDMIKVLSGEIKDNNFKLIEGDFLKQDLDWKNKKTLVANIPYYITSDILFKLFKNINKFDKAVLMIQEEVCDRLVAPVGSKQYGKLTISANHFATIKKEFVVKPQSFSPAPKVNSAIVTLTFNKNNNIDNGFLEFVKDSFAMRRKKLVNNWKRIMPMQDCLKIMQELKIKDTARPQELTYETFLKAYKLLNK